MAQSRSPKVCCPDWRSATRSESPGHNEFQSLQADSVWTAKKKAPTVFVTKPATSFALKGRKREGARPTSISVSSSQIARLTARCAQASDPIVEKRRVRVVAFPQRDAVCLYHVSGGRAHFIKTMSVNNGLPSGNTLGAVMSGKRAI